jgi:hypothetical protein
MNFIIYFLVVKINKHRLVIRDPHYSHSLIITLFFLFNRVCKIFSFFIAFVLKFNSLFKISTEK